MENIARQIREATGLNQVEFSRKLGRSLSMLQIYERSQGNPPLDVMDRLRSIAAEYGRGDLGLACGTFEVKRVVQPGETLISTARSPHQRRHQLLDAILTSHNQAAITAVQSALTLFAAHAGAPAPAKPKLKIPGRRAADGHC